MRGPRALRPPGARVVVVLAGAAALAETLAEGRGALALVAVVLLTAALGTRHLRTAGVLAVAGAAAVGHLDQMSLADALLVAAAAFRLCRAADVPTAAGVLVLCVAALEWNATDDDSVPSFFLVTAPAIAGWAMRGRDALARELAQRADELTAEQEVYAELSVRYERARIAAELHDVVGHAVSLMVIQAGAGQRLVERDPDAAAAAAFATIADAARQAESDIARLVALLGDDRTPESRADLDLVEELVSRAAGTGLHVTLRLEGDCRGLPESALRCAFLVVREGMTNALRHAPGAAVQVCLAARERELVVDVVNGPAAAAVDGAAPADADVGGGTGLRGLRDRLAGARAAIEAGPHRDGGWRLRARVPHGA